MIIGRHTKQLLKNNRLHFSTKNIPKFFVRNELEMTKIGALLAKNAKKGDIFLLQGDLGCGKTCFARGFLREYLQDDSLRVTSPTYLLVNSYEHPNDQKPIVYHMDLYRLDDVSQSDAEALGLSEAFEEGISLVEWPERLGGNLPKQYMKVDISYDDIGNEQSGRHVQLIQQGNSINTSE